MTDDRQKVLWEIFIKGSDNISDIDKLTLESNPELMEDLVKLSEIKKSSAYNKSIDSVNEVLSNYRGVKRNSYFLQDKRKAVFYSLRAAVILIVCAMGVFLFFIFYSKNQQALSGSDTNLFINFKKIPGKFIRNEAFFTSGDEIDIGFSAVNVEYKQGLLFSINENNNIKILYRFDSSTMTLNQVDIIKVKDAYKLENNGKYIFFFLVFSVKNFNEENFIKRVSNIIHSTDDIEKIKNKPFIKNKSIKVIKLTGEGI